MASVSFGIKNFEMFFDRTKVERLIERKERIILNRTGGFGRLTMRRSIRKAPKKRKNYKPKPPYPRYHTHPNAGLRTVLYAYSPARASVIIGPLIYGKSGRTAVRYHKGKTSYDIRRQPVPQLLNEGGTVTRITRYKSGRTYKRSLKYRKFPFATLAMAPTIKKMQELIEQQGLL